MFAFGSLLYNSKVSKCCVKYKNWGAYASVDNGFLGVKIFNITLNYMNYLYISD
jgi:hypothetical protein